MTGTASGSAVGWPATVRVAGMDIAALDLDSATAWLLEGPAVGRRISAHLATTHTLALAEGDPTLRAALQHPSAVLLADGVPLAWVGRLRGSDTIGRVCGLDLLPAMVDRGRAVGARHFLYGGAPGAAERLAETLRVASPGAVFVGIESPPFRALTAQEAEETIARINAAAPDHVWVGLGTPKQDLWLAEFRDRLDAPSLLAVGAAFEIVAGTRRRAPRWMQRAGFEWLFRLVLEPGRLWRRYLWGNSRFVWLVVRETVTGRRLRGRRRTSRP